MRVVTRADIFRYAAERYGTEPEYLWMKYPNYAILRHADNRKWYAAVLDVPKDKLGLPGEGVVDILDIKCDPILMGSLLCAEGFLPGYHMNKENWITILLDGSVAEGEIFGLLDLSYEMTKKKARKK